jgi:hypothetical protein
MSFEEISRLESRLYEIEEKFHKFNLSEIGSLEKILCPEPNAEGYLYAFLSRSGPKALQKSRKWLVDISYKKLMRIKNTNLLHKFVTDRNFSGHGSGMFRQTWSKSYRDRLLSRH